MSKERDIASICARLAELEAERSELIEQLEEAQRGPKKVGSHGDSPLTANSTATEKITLFRRLFAGRPDVFPVRWEIEIRGNLAMRLPARMSGYAVSVANHK